MSQNVMIPLSLLDKLIELLESWDISEYGYPVRDEYCHILWALRLKKQKLELRGAYARIINADSQDDADRARIDYLQKKRMVFEDEPPF